MKLSLPFFWLPSNAFPSGFFFFFFLVGGAIWFFYKCFELLLLLFVFLGLHLQHMEIARLGVQLELYPPAYATATATLHTAHGNAGSLTH